MRLIWCVWLLLVAPLAASQSAPGSSTPAAGVGVPVMFRGQEITRFYRRVGMLSPEERAAVVERRIDALVRDLSVRPEQLAAEHGPATSAIVRDGRALIVLSHEDAAVLGMSGTEYGELVLGRIRGIVATTRAEFTTRAILIGLGRVLLYTAIFVVAALAAWRLRRLIDRRIAAWRGSRRAGEAIESVTRVTGMRPLDAIGPLLRLVSVGVILAMALVWAEMSMEALPWTAPFARLLRGYAAAPLFFLWNGFIGFVPDALFIVVIAVATRLLLRLIHMGFRGIELGAIRLETFPPEWAEPTYKMMRVLVLALALVAAFPYIPGSSSPAFQGISLFLGLLVSLSSSSAISNIIAGTVLTYTRAFRLGDVVQIGGTTGLVVGKSLLVTSVRTNENVSVSIPNAVVLGAEIRNFTKLSADSGLVLTTDLTIGYDVPWRTVRDLLVQAARKTAGVLADPPPIVRQKSLDDFYVTYRLNAFTRNPRLMVATSSDLHAAILDEFAAARVEIMSPHYRAQRDGTTPAIPPEEHP